MILTLAAALLLPGVVFVYVAATTSDWTPSQRQIRTWQIGEKVLRDTGEGITFSLGKAPIRLFYMIQPSEPAIYSSFSCELYLQKPIRPKVVLYYRNITRTNEHVPFRSIDLSSQIRSPRWNNIYASVDEALDLQKANEFVLSFTSPRGPNAVRVRNASLESFSLPERCSQMLASLFEWQPLTHKNNNAMLSPKLAGHGFTYVLWAALPLSLIILLIRRSVFRETFSLVVHGVVTVLVFFVMIDLRNNVDRFLHVQRAIARYTQSQDLHAYLDDLYWGNPLFSETLRYLKEELPSDSPYYITFGQRVEPLVRQTCYYARPARRVRKIEEADVVLLLGASAVDFMFDRFQEWNRKTTLPNGVMVFERQK